MVRIVDIARPENGHVGMFGKYPTSHTLDLNSVSALHEHDEKAERVDSSAKAVSKFHTHSIPLDMEDIERDWDKPVTESGIAAQSQRDRPRRHA